MELVRGQIDDRPWGQTLGALGRRGLTGQLTLVAGDGKQYCIAFQQGAVVGATSPLVADSAARIAITAQLITPPQLAQVTRYIQEHPEQDDTALVVAAASIDPERAMRLRQRVIAQRAARTFAIERGTFVVEDEIAITAVAQAAIDIRAIVLLGTRTNVTEQRLASELSRLGTRFTLKPEVLGDLGQFGLTQDDAPIIEDLRSGATVPELKAKYGSLDPRHVQAVVYALASCFACTITMDPAAAEPPTDGVVIRGRTTNPPFIAEGTGAARTVQGTQPPTLGRPQPTPQPTPQPAPAIARTTSSPVVGRTATPTRAPLRPSGTTIPPAPYVDSPSQSGRMADSITLAADAYKRAHELLRDEANVPRAIDELTTATTINPHNFDYKALLEFAQFCAQPDRARDAKTADKLRKMFNHGIQKSRDPDTARYYLGRVERLVGRDKEALAHFQQVQQAQPQNEELAVEIRALEEKLAGGGGAEKSGGFSLFRKR